MLLRLIRGGSPEAAKLLDRSTRFDGGVDDAVAAILREVRTRGDDAVAEYTRKFDRREPPYEIPRARWDAVAAEVEPRVKAALELAAYRIRAFHERQHENDVDITLDGVRLEL